MLNLTDGAKELLDQHFANKSEIPLIRVYLAAGWGGPQLGLALDEQKETDEVINSNGYTFIMEKSLTQTAGQVEIDGGQFGFQITSNLNAGANDQGCSSCSSC